MNVDHTLPASIPEMDVQRFWVRVLNGAERGREATSIEGRLTVGSAEGNTLQISHDPHVSRYHLELEASTSGITLRDLGSTNGTWIASVCVREAVMREDTELCVGSTRLRISTASERENIPTTRSDHFHDLIGASKPMRALYQVLERAAPTMAPVLITGENGTGKELTARAIHRVSGRSEGAFVVVDCGAMPPTLIESELFGHQRGAFTGATHDREGAFERADGGTIFLDEIGELPLEVQPKLLRVLAEGTIQRVGSGKVRKVDVRVVAATNRELRAEVNAHRFRMDLYYRLAVITARVPPLRDRLDDLPLLVPELVARIQREHGIAAVTLPDDLYLTLRQHTWPGNVRELRNWLENLLILNAPPPVEASSATNAAEDALFAEFASLPLKRAREHLLERFDRRYVTLLLERSAHNVAEAARQSNVDRGTLFRLIRRYNLRGV